MSHCSDLMLFMRRFRSWRGALSIILPILPAKKKLHQQHFTEVAGESVPRVGKRKVGSECVSGCRSQQPSRTFGLFLKE